MKQLLNLRTIAVLLLVFVSLTQAQSARSKREALRDSLLQARSTPQSNTTQPQKPQSPAAVAPSSSTVSQSIQIPSTTLIELPIADSLVVEALNIRDTDIRDLLQGLAVQYNLNLLLANDVRGPVSVNFSRIPLRKALRIIVEENGYELQVDGNAIKVRRPQPKPQPVPESKNRINVAYQNGKLSLDLDQAPLDQVVRRLVEVTGANVISDGSTAPVSVFLKDLELSKALRMLAEGNRLDAREREGIWHLTREAVQGGGDSPSSKTWITVKDSLVTIEVSDAPLQQVLGSLTQQAGVGTVLYGKLTGTVTARINNVPFEEALKYLFRGTAFTFWRINGIYFIGSHDMQSGNNSALITLKHMRAEDVVKLLPAALTRDMQIQVVRSQNALMVMGAYENLDAVREYIEKMDLPIPQILMEVLVLDVDIEKARQYGVDLFLGKASKSMGKETIYPAVDQTLNGKQAQGVIDKVGLGDIISLPKDFVAKIQALEQEKILNVKARSQIATLNGETAVLTIGQTQYFLLKSETDYNSGSAVTNKTTERFEKVEANATITVTPYVTGQGEVTCEIIPDFSEPEGSFDSQVPPTLNKRYVKASVRLRNGETIILGGMVKESTNEVHRQFPFLGSIPILGWLFKNVEQVTSRSQLLIYVTPKIYYGSEGSVDLKAEIKKASEG